MRIKVMDRVLVALAGLILAALGVGAAMYALGAWQITLDLGALARDFVFWQRALIVVISLALLTLGGYCLFFLLRRIKEKGFFLQHTEFGDLNISMHAMENMVRKCIDTHSELKVSGTRIHRAKEGVVVDMRISLANGVNIPLTVNALQKQIKHYITSCSGVDVKEVRVMVETNNSMSAEDTTPVADVIAADANAAAQTGVLVESLNSQTILKTDEPEAHEEKEAIHQRLFKHEDEPHIVPPPPEADAPVAADVPSAPDGEPAPDDEPMPDSEPASDSEPAAEQDADESDEK